MLRKRQPGKEITTDHQGGRKINNQTTEPRSPSMYTGPKIKKMADMQKIYCLKHEHTHVPTFTSSSSPETYLQWKRKIRDALSKP